VLIARVKHLHASYTGGARQVLFYRSLSICQSVCLCKNWHKKLCCRKDTSCLVGSIDKISQERIETFCRSSKTFSDYFSISVSDEDTCQYFTLSQTYPGCTLQKSFVSTGVRRKLQQF